MFFSSSVTPEEWQDFSHANIEKAERDIQSSVELRSVVDGLLQQTANDMRKQCNEVNVAFSKRIAETKDTKGKLEDHLNKVTWISFEAFEACNEISKNVANATSNALDQPAHTGSLIRAFASHLNIL